MTRQFGSACLALIFTLTLFGAVASPAAAKSPHYQAEPVTAPAAERLVVRDLVWRCGAGGCRAAQGNSRAAVECAALVREVGRLRSFSAGGQALAPAELEKCNARAR